MTLSNPKTQFGVPQESGPNGRSLPLISITLATCLIFCTFALTDSGWGPILAPLASQLHIPLATIGLIYVLWTIGYLPGALLGGTLLDRYGPQRVLFWAAIAILIGIATVCLGIFLPRIISVRFLLVILTLAGVGGGVIDATTNGLISAVFAEQRGRALSLFNLLYPLSGIVIALIDAWLLTIFSNNPLPPLLFTVGFILTAMFSLLGIPRDYRLVQKTNTSQQSEQPQKSRQSSFFALLFPVIVVMMFTGGTNSTVRTWAPAYLHVAFGQTPGSAAALSSITWIFSMLSRLLVAWLIIHIGSWRIAIISILVALLGFTLLLISPNAIIATFAIALITIGLSPIFAICITIGSERVPGSPGRISGILLFAGGSGSVLLNWLFGLMLNSIGPIWAVLLCFIVVIIGGLITLQLRIS